jgi:LysR family glycine cleavage system transcriptional activator
MSVAPPLQAVRVFEAVARHGNFTRAAAELNMTQSAVSYQVKLLEDFVGAPLFERLARGVALSDKGRALAPVVARALADIAQSFRTVRGEADNLLTITTMETFANNWLAPRIGSFQLRHPELAVRFDVSARLVDLEHEDADVAIRSGRGDWPGMASHMLMEQTFTPLASPLYIAREGKPEVPGDLLRHVLIAPSDDWWGIWFANAGIQMATPIPRPGVDVETQHMATRLALAGHGVALATPGFVDEDLRAGRLVPLFELSAVSGLNYYLVYPVSRRTSHKIRAFRDWILQEAGQG